MTDFSPQSQSLSPSASIQGSDPLGDIIKNGDSLEIRSDDNQWTMKVEDANGNKFAWGMDKNNNFYVEKNGKRLLEEEADDDKINIYFEDDGVRFFKDDSALELEGGNINFKRPARVTEFSEGEANAEHGETYVKDSNSSLTESESFNDFTALYDERAKDYYDFAPDGSDYEIDIYTGEQKRKLGSTGYGTDGSISRATSSTASEPLAKREIAPGTSAAELREHFAVEGEDPFISANTLSFDALSSAHVTENGNGFRNELKIDESQRADMTATDEVFNADVTVNLSPGSKTIIAQHHASDTGTLMKVYVSDTDEFEKGAAADGTFEVYARLEKPDGSGEEVVQLGTVQSGDTFDLSVQNDHGFVSVSSDTLGSSASLQVKDSSESYFKFGNYLQAQDPYTLKKASGSDNFAALYDKFDITESVVTFANVGYSRAVD